MNGAAMSGSDGMRQLMRNGAGEVHHPLVLRPRLKGPEPSMSRQTFALAFVLALAAWPAAAMDHGADYSEGRDSYQGESRAPYQGESREPYQSESLARRGAQGESFGHGYDPYDDGTEAWFAPNGGSWADHVDAYYGYGECHFVREPVIGQWGEIVDHRQVRVCD
jgi:hypothetical protein